MIFVSIASYRDPELLLTIKNLIEKAYNPKNIVIGICQQNDSDKFITTEYENVKFLNFKPEFSKGVCWARNKSNSLYNGEELFLQCDSHMEFVKDWDRLIANEVCMANKLTNNPVVFAAYPSAYQFKNGIRFFVGNPKIYLTKLMFMDHPSSIILTGYAIKNNFILDRPIKSRYLNGGFMFGNGAFLRDIKIDTDIYFHGEEIMTTLKAYTNGYDLFHPSRHICWHNYNRLKDHGDFVCHWNQDDESKRKVKWRTLDDKSKKRVAEIISGIYKGENELGSVRTIQDYEKYACVKFRNRIVYGDGLTGIYKDN